MDVFERTKAAVVLAGTVVCLRDGNDGLEALLVRRAPTLAFGGGAWAFPGGRVEPGDWAGIDPSDDLGAARHAAVREASEETGIVLDPDGLVALSCWTPPESSPRRYRTWFFLSKVLPGAIEVDGEEIVDHCWLTPGDALVRHAEATMELLPPTWVTLHGLKGSVEEALAGATARQPLSYDTRIVASDAGPTALWLGDSGYADGDLARRGARHRLEMRRRPWTFERSR